MNIYECKGFAVDLGQVTGASKATVTPGFTVYILSGYVLGSEYDEFDEANHAYDLFVEAWKANNLMQTPHC